MSRKNYLVSVMTFLLFTDCNLPEPKDLTVIDGLQLGTTLDKFYTTLDSLKIQKREFYTKVVFSDIGELNSNKITGYVTTIFNSNKYSSASTQHYGLYWPAINTGTQNVIGLQVLLSHTDNAAIINKEGIVHLTRENHIPAISQEISYNLDFDIPNMLSKKYGKPFEKKRYIPANFYVLEGSQIKEYAGDSTNKGDLTIWKTKYFDIKYFEGLLSRKRTFNNKTNSYMYYFQNDAADHVDLENGEEPCYAYCYISYVLNKETIKKLSLDKPKL